MQGNVRGQAGGGLSIDGVINSYIAASGQNISAGDFVEFARGGFSSGTDTTVSSLKRAGQIISATQLSDNKVFIAHIAGIGSDATNLYGVVCTINNTTITIGTDTQLGSCHQYPGISVVALSESKIFIAYGSGNSNHIINCICTVSGTTISKQSSYGTTSWGNTISATKISENKVFVAHSAQTSSGCYGYVCTIDGITITKGADTLIPCYSLGTDLSAVTLFEDKVFIAQSSYNSGDLYATVCTINDTTITIGTALSFEETLFNNNTNHFNLSATVLNENKVFLAFVVRNASYNGYIYGVICTIDGTTITKGSKTALTSSSYYAYIVSAITLSKNIVYLTYGKGSSDLDNSIKLNGGIYIISGTTISNDIAGYSSSEQYSGYRISTVLATKEKIFIAHSGPGTGNNSDYYDLKAVVINAELKVKKVVSSSQFIEGVAKTSGTAGQSIQVYEPNI